MRTTNNGTMRGTRAGAGPAGEPHGRGLAVAKVVVLYHCANHHQTVVPFISTAEVPGSGCVPAAARPTATA